MHCVCEIFFVVFYIALSISNFLILFFPDFRQILFLFIYLMHPCTWFIFCTVLTVSLMTGLSSLGALPQCDIVFTWDFSVFCHFIFLDSALENYNGMKELSEKRKSTSQDQEMPVVINKTSLSLWRFSADNLHSHCNHKFYASVIVCHDCPPFFHHGRCDRLLVTAVSIDVKYWFVKRANWCNFHFVIQL